MNFKRLLRGPALWIVLILLAVWIASSSLLGLSVSRIYPSAGIAPPEQGKAAPPGWHAGGVNGALAA